MFRKIEDVVETLRNAQRRGKKCSVLIGAGCSVTAGIPTAQGFVERIQKDYPLAYDRAEEKTYPKCMAELSTSEQRDLIAEYVDNARINWGHIALAQLMKAGVVDRVLTTNFDQLVMRASALIGIFPAIYDFAASQCFERDKIPEKSIFHLHGQRTGFILINTPADYEKHSSLLAPVFEDAGSGRVWLIVGYSGENDPVFDHLAKVPRFDNFLYWVGYCDNEPAAHLQKKLLLENKDAYYVKGFDADNFFVTLAQILECFPPDFVKTPFSYLNNIFETLTPYTFPKTSAPVNVVFHARKFVQDAIDNIEPIQEDVLGAWSDLLKGDYEKVINLKSKYADPIHPELSDAIAWGFLMQGNALSDEAKLKIGDEADELFQQAGQKYAAALEIEEDSHEALNNWGIALYEQAMLKKGAEANELFRQAGQKYAAALVIKPDSHEALNNWGATLADQAKLKTGDEADELFRQAGRRYTAALKIKKDFNEALYNWGNTLYYQAKLKTGDEADDLFRQGGQKYAAALEIKKDLNEALYNWGATLADQATLKTGDEADDLFRQAGKKYAAALEIKPDKHEALSNWGNALSDQAKLKTGDEADKLFRQAGQKYAAALEIKNDYHEALYNWGIALYAQAKLKTGDEADELFRQAGQKYAAALEIKKDYHEALNNWGNALLVQYYNVSNKKKTQILTKAKNLLHKLEKLAPGYASYNLACLYSLSGEQEKCKKWLLKSKKVGRLPGRKHLEEDKDLDPIRNSKWFIDFLTKLK